MTIKDSFKKFFTDEPKNETTVESKELDIKLPNIPIKNKNLLYWLSLIPVFLVALYVRTRNLPLLQGKYLIELDTYFFFRYAQMLLTKGSVPAIDMMRYVPVGAPTAGILFFPKTMVFFYKIAHFFFANLSQIEWHIIYPPVITVISLVFFFLFVKELLGHRTAFIATAFLAVIPAYLQRTMAGFADHDTMTMLWIFISLWLFALAWKSKNSKIYVPLFVVSGLVAGAAAATSGLYTFLVLAVSFFVFAFAFLTNKYKASLFRFLPWGLAYFLFSVYLSAQPILNSAKSLQNIVLFFTLIFLLIGLLLTKIPKLSSLKIPQSIIVLLVTFILTLTVNFALSFADLTQFFIALTKEGASRHFFTVAENAQPYFFNDWWGGFGFIFLLAFIGSAIYFYKLFEPEGKSRFKLHWLATAAFVFFILTFIFGRLSTSGSSVVSFFSST